MNRLLRLFPREWLDRYGTEFKALLEAMPLTPAIVSDVVLAAVRARVQTTARTLVHTRARLATPRARQLGGGAGVVGGLIWAATIAVGTAVDWGRYGRDLGNPVMVSAAAILLGAQVAVAAATPVAGRRMAWAGVGTSVVGVGVLCVAVVAAITLEPPLVIRLPWSPQEVWEAGMLATMVGIATVALATVWTRDSGWLVAGLLVITALLLAVALLVTFDQPAGTFLGGGVGAAQMGAAERGWFVSRPWVVAAGVVFGSAWVMSSTDRLRRARLGLSAQKVPASEGR